MTPIFRWLAFRSRQKKVFCVGRNKTGTTSLAAALRGLGYRVGDQRKAELLIEDWAKRDFRRLTSYCRQADAFQDSPFSHDFTFQAMDQAFPRSKFILTIRDSDEQWYASLVRFHTMRMRKRTGEDRLPTVKELQQDPHIYPGYIWRRRQLVMGISENGNPYDKDLLVKQYNEHNRRVLDYFRHRPSDLLVLNVAEPSAMEKLCRFLGCSSAGQSMPLLNASK